MLRRNQSGTPPPCARTRAREEQLQPQCPAGHIANEAVDVKEDGFQFKCRHRGAAAAGTTCAARAPSCHRRRADAVVVKADASLRGGCAGPGATAAGRWELHWGRAKDGEELALRAAQQVFVHHVEQ